MAASEIDLPYEDDEEHRLARATARFIDRFLRPRLSMFIDGVFVRVIATVSLLISLAMRR